MLDYQFIKINSMGGQIGYICWVNSDPSGSTWGNTWFGRMWFSSSWSISYPYGFDDDPPLIKILDDH